MDGENDWQKKEQTSRIEEHILPFRIHERYECRKEIGKGASGTVYLAYDLKLEKEWAVKECKKIASAELLAFQKQNCEFFPRIVDVVTLGEKQFLIMDYINGITLKDRILEGYITEREVIAWASKIAEGIRCLHHMEPPILYLDCKPENIMLTPNQEIKIIDFGSMYACRMQTEEEKLQQPVSGTVFYAPYEQRNLNSKQRHLDERTDIYAFGMTLYRLITRKEREYRNRQGRLCTRDANPAVSYALDHVIAKCCAFLPKDRYQSMDEVIHQLQHIKEIEKQERRKQTIWKAVYAVGKISCLIGMAISFYFFSMNTSDMIKSMISGIFFLVFSLFYLVIRHDQKKKGSVIWEMKKDIYGAIGKKVLFIGMIFALLFQENVMADGKGDHLQVVLYDEQGRKVLIQGDSIYYTQGDIILKIPKQEMTEKTNLITISCQEEESKEGRTYSFRCSASEK